MVLVVRMQTALYSKCPPLITSNQRPQIFKNKGISQRMSCICNGYFRHNIINVFLKNLKLCKTAHLKFYGKNRVEANHSKLRNFTTTRALTKTWTAQASSSAWLQTASGDIKLLGLRTWKWNSEHWGYNPNRQRRKVQLATEGEPCKTRGTDLKCSLGVLPVQLVEGFFFLFEGYNLNSYYSDLHCLEKKIHVWTNTQLQFILMPFTNCIWANWWWKAKVVANQTFSWGEGKHIRWRVNNGLATWQSPVGELLPTDLHHPNDSHWPTHS